MYLFISHHGLYLVPLNKFSFLEGHYNVLLNYLSDLTCLTHCIFLSHGEDDLFEKLPRYNSYTVRRHSIFSLFVSEKKNISHSRNNVNIFCTV